MGSSVKDNKEERSLPVVLMIDSGLTAERRALAEWLENSPFSACNAVDIFDAINEIADFTVKERPDVIVLDTEACHENLSLLRSVFQTEILKLSQNRPRPNARDCFEGDLAAVTDRLKKLIPQAPITN